MAKRFQAPKGTRDLLPPDTALWARVEASARRVFGLYGYREIRTPIFEETELFTRGVGESTDIVGKEMYTFTDKGERSLTLRPESTAAVCRAYVEHGMQSLPQPVRLFYIGPQFRYERPQKGRFRQFHQIGAELLGGRGAESDSEVLLMLVRFLRELGFGDLKVLINTVGDAESRAAYREALRDHLLPMKESLSEDSRRRLETNPLRILDTKSAEEQALLAFAPRLEGSLTPAAAAHFERVLAAMDAFGLAYSVEPKLVRGLDYYTNTVFEIVSEGLGAQNAICGGGAYEGLVEELGGPPTYGVGFAIGEDRLLEVLPADSPARRPGAGPVLVTFAGKAAREGEAGSALVRVLEELRAAGIACQRGLRSRRQALRAGREPRRAGGRLPRRGRAGGGNPFRAHALESRAAHASARRSDRRAAGFLRDGEAAMKRRGAGTLQVEDVGTRVLLQAWVQRRRNLGGLHFLDLRDRSGLCQVVVRPEDHPEIVALLEPVRSEWVVEIEGEVVRRESVNAQIATGEVEVIAERAAVLSPSDPLPFTLEAHAEASEETRLKYRYLDLRRPELQRNMILRHRITQRDAALLRRARLPRDRDADPDQVDARRARATTWCRRASIPASSTPCRSRRSSSSSSA